MNNYKLHTDYDQILFREEVARGTRNLNIKGYSQAGDSGDIGIRDPKSGLIYISGSPDWCYQRNLLDARGWERFITDLDETIYIPWTEGTIEWKMHTAVLRSRPDMNASVHTHSKWASIFAAAEMSCPLDIIGEGLTGEIPLTTPFAWAGSPEIEVSVTEALQKFDCCILSHHGAVVVGKTLDEAFDKVAWMEQACEKAFWQLVANGGAQVNLEKAFSALRK